MKKIFAAGFCIFTTVFSFGQDTLKSNNTKPSRTILFICEHGAARSAIAAAWFNKLAQQQGLNYSAIFRGTSPDSVIGHAAQKGLRRDGFDVNGWKPLPLTNRDIENAHQVVTLDCLLPENTVAGPVIQWKGIPPTSEDYNIARDSIVKKVQALVAELSLKSKARD